MGNRCYYHRARKFFLENGIVVLLKQMGGEADDKKFVEVLLVGMIGKAKIKTDEVDRDALDLIVSEYCFDIRSVFLIFAVVVK